MLAISGERQTTWHFRSASRMPCLTFPSEPTRESETRAGLTRRGASSGIGAIPLPGRSTRGFFIGIDAKFLQPSGHLATKSGF